MSLTIPAVFLAGVLSFLSPCFLPVVPVFVSSITGVRKESTFIGASSPKLDVLTPAGTHNAGTHHAVPRVATCDTVVVEQRHSRKPALLAIAFVAAFSLVFTGLWVAVGLIGWVVGDARQLLSIIGGVLLILLGLHLAGLIRIPILDRVMTPSIVHGDDEGPSYRRSVLLGLSFGAGWTPCIGPILGGVLGLTTTKGSVGEGFLLLVVFCLGLGVPFVLSAIAADKVFNSLNGIKRHYKLIELILGLALVAVGFLMLSGLLERLALYLPVIEGL